MAPTLDDLLAAIERDQTALAALLQANLAPEAADDTDAMVARQRTAAPIMARLSQATADLTSLCRAQGTPAGLAPRLEAWRAELSVLLAALESRTPDLATRREAVGNSLRQLHRASQGFSGYRQANPPGATFVQKKA